MNYFDYLRMTNKKDIKENFISYLIDILNYTKEQAERESNFYYK